MLNMVVKKFSSCVELIYSLKTVCMKDNWPKELLVQEPFIIRERITKTKQAAVSLKISAVFSGNPSSILLHMLSSFE